jgi:secretion/DNA translocation related TadE-like protein
VTRTVRIAPAPLEAGPARRPTGSRSPGVDRRTDGGSATVVLIAVLAAVSFVVVSGLTAAGLRVASARAQGAADTAALTAAAATVGLVPGPPCAAARRSARAVAAELRTCSVTGTIARVVVVVGSGPLSVGAVAVAGPEDDADASAGAADTGRVVRPEVADRLRLRRASTPECVWCACRPAGHRVPGRPGRIHDVRRLTSTIDQGDTCQARRSS